MELIGLWIVCAIVTAWIANRKRRSTVGFFLLGLVLGIFALVIVLFVPANKAMLEAEAVAKGKQMRCRFCAELVRTDARVCRHCGRDLFATSPA